MKRLSDFLFYSEPSIMLYCGDCRDIMPLLDHYDVIITDPPYGIDHPTDYHSRGRGKLAACRDYSNVVGDAEPFDPAWLLALGKPICLWGANHYASRLPDSSGWLVWDKERPDTLDQSTCELAWTNYIHGVRRFRWLWNGMMMAHPENLVHPTQKPLALMIWCLNLRWTPLGTVVDPYMGSGTTLEAAKILKRPAIGIEIEPTYCKIAVKRLSQEILDL